MGLAQLERGKARRQGLCVDELFHKHQGLPHPWVAPGKLSPKKPVVVVITQLFQQGLVGEKCARKIAIAHAQSNWREGSRTGFLNHIEELLLAELFARRQLDAEIREHLLIIVHLHRPGLQRQTVYPAFVCPSQFRPGFNVIPVQGLRKVIKQIVLHILCLVWFRIKDIRSLARQ
ncbi:MAG: hypothetical protein ACD_74C00074G0001 [uncultured bacterium]|nr:MAG: hypothetical protein ACD_74C00074G0001 [uncultured bacterium]